MNMPKESDGIALAAAFNTPSTAHNTGIGWTHRPGTTGETWNPIVGCSIVSPGCIHCYAMAEAGRRLDVPGSLAVHYRGTTRKVDGKSIWTGKIARASDKTMTKPLRWREPRTVFVNSMGDLFHEDAPDDWIAETFAVMFIAAAHTFIILTKRSGRMRELMTSPAFLGLVREHVRKIVGEIHSHSPKLFDPMPSLAFPNVWVGVSAERQKEADERIPDLLTTPAAVRLVSLEPLIEQVDLEYIAADGITEIAALSGNHIFSDLPNKRRLDWVIVGGESGPDHRPFNLDWARSIRDQCQAADVPYFFKQVGGLKSYSGGRMLDGREWTEWPG